MGQLLKTAPFPKSTRVLYDNRELDRRITLLQDESGLRLGMYDDQDKRWGISGNAEVAPADGLSWTMLNDTGIPRVVFGGVLTDDNITTVLIKQKTIEKYAIILTANNLRVWYVSFELLEKADPGGFDPLKIEASAADGTVLWKSGVYGSTFINGRVDPAETAETASPAATLLDPKLDFSISLKDTLLSLHDRSDEADLAELLGTPLTEETHTLQNADTLTGSFLQELTFPGLEMQLFSPKQDGSSFWIMNMQIKNSLYVTSRGLRVGMMLRDLKAVYPDIEPIHKQDADSENNTYEIGTQETYDYARYEIIAGVIREIYLHHEIP
jgi:hypothetical protein